MFSTVIVVDSVRQNLKKFITNDDKQFPFNVIPDRVLSVLIVTAADNILVLLLWPAKKEK
jgi:hypothetical protein